MTARCVPQFYHDAARRQLRRRFVFFVVCVLLGLILLATGLVCIVPLEIKNGH